LSLFADGTINYSYDASGNRVYAEHVINLRQAEMDSTGKVKPMLHELTSHRITIYPNPTDGNFSIEIGTPETIEQASITIYSMSGTIIYREDEPDAVNEIDITSSPDGMYMLIIRIDGETSTWKIIKN
jgi:hypothetical protein